jgi:hypothetical protein
MSLSEDVFTTLMGGTPERRVYPDVMPQRAVLPALVYTLIAGVDDFHLGGLSGLKVRLIQVDAWATTRISADRLIAEASQAMVESQLFQVNAIAVTGADMYETETERYRASLEFTIWTQQQ